MKKFVLFFVFMLCTLFVVSTATGSLILKKNNNGTYSIVEQKLLKRKIPKLPEEVKLSNKKIINLVAEGNTENYTIKKEKLIKLFPLPTNETTITEYNISFKKGKWNITISSQKNKSKTNIFLCYLFIVFFLLIIGKTKEYVNKIHTSIIIDLVILIIPALALVLCAYISKTAGNNMFFVLIALGATITFISQKLSFCAAPLTISSFGASCVAGEKTVFIYQYFLSLISIIIISYFLLFLWKKMIDKKNMIQV